MAKRKATPKKGATKTAKLKKAETKTEKPKKGGPKTRPKLVLARKKKPAPKRRATKEPIVEPTVPPSENEKAVRDYDRSMQREERIRMHAYLKWEAAGKPAGDGDPFWLEAEREYEAECKLEADREP